MKKFIVEGRCLTKMFQSIEKFLYMPIILPIQRDGNMHRRRGMILI